MHAVCGCDAGKKFRNRWLSPHSGFLKDTLRGLDNHAFGAFCSTLIATDRKKILMSMDRKPPQLSHLTGFHGFVIAHTWGNVCFAGMLFELARSELY